MEKMKFVNHQIIINANDKMDEICVVVPGKWQGHPAGDYQITEGDIIQILENFKAEGRDILFDYDHDSIFGKSIAAGWGKDLYEKDGKLYAKTEWTPKAKESIKNKEYKYLSNVIIFNYSDPNNPKIRGTYLHSIALTNMPFQKEMPAIANNIKNNVKIGKGGTMDAKMQALLDKLKAKDADEAIRNAESLMKENENLKTEISDLKEKIVSNSIEIAIAEGKLLPADKEIALQLLKNSKETYEKFIENRKQEIPKILVKKNKQEPPKKEFTEFIPEA